MKKIKSYILAAAAIALAAPVFISCSSDNTPAENVQQTIQNIVSEFAVNDQMVAAQKAASGKKVAVLLVAFGSTWNNAFKAFDQTKAAYEAAFPNADVYVCFSSDICINRASVGENADDDGNIIKRDYYEPRYLLHAIGNAKYEKIYVQSLQVIPGEEFAGVVAAVKKFMNNGYLGDAHLDDAYLSKLSDDKAIFLGMPLLNDPVEDVNKVAAVLAAKFANELTDGCVAFMGHGNPDNYDTFKANERYKQLEDALQTISNKFFVGTVDMLGNYKQNVMERMKAKGFNNGKLYLHALMSIAGDHAHNDMAGEGDEYWKHPMDPEHEEHSWYEYFSRAGYNVVVPLEGLNGLHPQGLLEIPGVRQVWIEHTQNADFLEDAYHSMYPETEE